MSEIKIQLSGDAREYFDDEVHHFLENEKLSIRSRLTLLDEKYKGIVPENWVPSDLVTVVVVTAGSNIDIMKEVKQAIENINKLYPNSTKII